MTVKVPVAVVYLIEKAFVPLRLTTLTLEGLHYISKKRISERYKFRRCGMKCDLCNTASKAHRMKQGNFLNRWTL